MGFAIAAAAARRGHSVTLIAGPVGLATPDGVHRRDVVSAVEMLDVGREVLAAERCATLVGVAAVSDFRPAERLPGKPAKHAARHRIDLVENPDVLGSLAALGVARLAVGFALEHLGTSGPAFDAAVERARGKLDRKKLHAIVLNGVPTMEAAEVEAWWITEDAVVALAGPASKAAVAEQLVLRIEASFR